MIRTRIAPSPTGSLHLGTARSALYNYIFAKQNNGKFVLRIEDTDNTRSTKFFENDIIDGLRWLGLDFDIGPEKEDEFGPYHQMQRLDIYQKYIDKLIDEGKAYYAYETADEIDELRKQAGEKKQPFIYRQINYTQEQLQQFESEGRKPVVRFKVEPKSLIFNDLVKGEISFDMSGFSDFVIMKSDGIPTFYMANVVDDYLMGITHILRGEDHIPNTPKQILLYEALGMQPPEFTHLPMLLNTNKSKISKRDTDNELVTISSFRQQGFLPEALVNFIALLGWHPSSDVEFFSMQELLDNFTIERINSSNAVYDYHRALRFNSEYIRSMSDDEFVDRLICFLENYGDQERKEILQTNKDKDYWLKLAPYIKVRIQTLGQFRDFAKYFFKPQMPTDEIIYNEKMKVDKKLVQDMLPKLLDLLYSIDEDNWTEGVLKEALINFVKQEGLKNGQVLWPIRSILTGVQASPGAFEMLYVLGKQESISRLKLFRET
ncbi:glutamate--tRNA ligase [Candidatus Absconditicoccus praedator]|uniref:glutamate--tRNA ligase n=1 Tax=Candidatus Absconditicoccus praedator TaxID=2735562 RepID=UPI001E547AB4|nr:glutamate--tRNA ligase [Candidatus Absconditicoccus praedator]UFX82832.1 glutamate--tRNA ligase [Candidatus Absconditicoccus praedator]